MNNDYFKSIRSQLPKMSDQRFELVSKTATVICDELRRIREEHYTDTSRIQFNWDPGEFGHFHVFPGNHHCGWNEYNFPVETSDVDVFTELNDNFPPKLRKGEVEIAVMRVKTELTRI